MGIIRGFYLFVNIVVLNCTENAPHYVDFIFEPDTPPYVVFEPDTPP